MMEKQAQRRTMMPEHIEYHINVLVADVTQSSTSGDYHYCEL
jgi:hypothetical protein